MDNKTIDQLPRSSLCQVALPKAAVEAGETFLNAPRKDRPFTDWYRRCTSGPAAAVFFKGPRDSDVFRLTACEIVAKTYMELSAAGDVEVIRPSLVLQVREKASSIYEMLPESQHLPLPADTREFREGLVSLSQWKVPVTAPTNNSGDPSMRALTLTLGRRFAEAFVQIPVDYIHFLVTFASPNRSLSATRRVLTSTVLNAIKQESEAFRKREQLAQATMTSAIQSAYSSSVRARVLSVAEQDAVQALENEIKQIKSGRSRFTSDAARLQAIKRIVDSFDDSSLANELRQLTTIALRSLDN